MDLTDETWENTQTEKLDEARARLAAIIREMAGLDIYWADYVDRLSREIRYQESIGLPPKDERH